MLSWSVALWPVGSARHAMTFVALCALEAVAYAHWELWRYAHSASVALCAVRNCRVVFERRAREHLCAAVQRAAVGVTLVSVCGAIFNGDCERPWCSRPQAALTRPLLPSRGVIGQSCSSILSRWCPARVSTDDLAKSGERERGCDRFIAKVEAARAGNPRRRGSDELGGKTRRATIWRK